MSSLFVPAIVLWLLWPAGAAQSPNAVTSEATRTVTVERVERLTRVVTFRGQDNVIQSVYVDPKIAAFDDLKDGDVVTVRYIESVIVEVRPDAKPTGVLDSTDAARKAEGEHIEQQLKMVVTVETIDPQGAVVTYRTHDNRRVIRAVRDKRLLEGVKPGDRVEITLTRARAVSIARGGR